MDPCVNLPLDAKTLNDVVEKAKDFCLMHGKSNCFLTYSGLPNKHVAPIKCVSWNFDH